MGRSNNAVSRAAWVSHFSNLSFDLDALFYYLSRNPWLCQFPSRKRSSFRYIESMKGKGSKQQKHQSEGTKAKQS